MPTTRLMPSLAARLSDLENAGRLKGAETAIAGVIPACDRCGPRYLLEGHSNRPFLRINSNGYLGLALKAIRRRRRGSRGAQVRHRSGCRTLHKRHLGRPYRARAPPCRLPWSRSRNALQLRLCDRVGIIPPRQRPDRRHQRRTQSQLHHQRDRAGSPTSQVDLPASRHGRPRAPPPICRRGLRTRALVTDGMFSMRGDHAPLERITELAAKYDEQFAENVIVIVDDSHGVGAFGRTGRGTEEATAGSRRRSHRHTRQGLRGQWRLSRLERPHGPLPARDVAPLHLLESDYARRSSSRQRGSCNRGERRGCPAARPPESDDLAIPSRARSARAGDVAGRAPCRAIDGARHGAHVRLTGYLAAKAFSRPGSTILSCPRATRRFASRSPADHTPSDIDEALSALARFPG